MEDTICAISTALGEGAISIIRISGKQSIKIVNKFFRGKNLSKVDSHTINYGKIYDKNNLIDEVLVSIFKSPKSYTCEDIVEINCHGSIISTKKILSLLLENGCRLAEPGEFTKRAFLNGRIDLLEAEAVQNILSSTSEKAHKMGLNQLTGSLSSVIKEERELLLNMLANIEVNIDYPEYEDAPQITNEEIKLKIKTMIKRITKYIDNSETGLIIKNGINICIVGKPNVGKSSILNKLSDNEKAIVTNIPGTTRDIIESEILLNGIKLNLIDTAGIRKTSDIVENIGVQKSLDALNKADLILFVLDYSASITSEDLELYQKIKNMNYLILVNKTDLLKKIDLLNFDAQKIIFGNTRNNNGLEPLKSKIIEMFDLGSIENKDLTYFSNIRQIDLLKKALKELKGCIKEINNFSSIDLIAVYVKNAWNYLGEIIGESYEEELLDNLFSKFCLGK